jgi:hypothetical protein
VDDAPEMNRPAHASCTYRPQRRLEPERVKERSVLRVDDPIAAKRSDNAEVKPTIPRQLKICVGHDQCAGKGIYSFRFGLIGVLSKLLTVHFKEIRDFSGRAGLNWNGERNHRNGDSCHGAKHWRNAFVDQGSSDFRILRSAPVRTPSCR